MKNKGNVAVLADHRVKIKESKTIEKYLDLARELKKLWTMKVTVIPIIVSALETVPKDPEKRLEELVIRGRIKSIETTALRSARIQRGVLES